MPLRCLLFSSDEGLAPPIWQVLADLGIEGEYCGNAVEAVERVTTQLFQIVITDWDDQPEAGFLLKTAREQKAANRPLTLAIVSDDSHLPLALQAGANSILRKPLAAEQVRDTLGTARDLLRAKLDSASAARASAAAPQAAFAAAASASASPAAAPIITVPIISAPPAAPASLPASVAKAPENTFRKGDFLQSTSSEPGKHFDTGTDMDAAKSAEQAAIAEQDPLTELEPMAAAVESVPQGPQAEGTQEQEKAEEPQGWTSVKARLARLRQEPAVSAPAAPKTELLSYSDNAAQPSPAAPQKPDAAIPAAETRPETKEEAQLFAYIAGESSEEPQPDAAKAPNRTARFFVVGALAAAAVVAVVKIPAAQQLVEKLTGPAVHAGKGWLNPPSVSQAQAPTQHETFGQAGDEYKLPVAGNIPDATTDPSQIRVLPVVDPTIKPGKGSAANGAQTQTPGATTENPSEPNQTGQAPVTDAASQIPGTTIQSAPEQPTGTTSAPIIPVAASPVPTNPPPAQVVSEQLPPAQSAPQTHPVSVVNNAAIPSSLKSQMASMTPEASGTKPVEAALQSIQPVDLPEAAARSLLLQQVDPAYPDAARKTRQQGNVVLSVWIAADGSVQDAKFMQGSLVFARAAIDAVRQWRFKPYVFNGRPTAAQTVITINFRPPAS